MAASVWILENSYVVYQGLRHIMKGLGSFTIEIHFDSFGMLKGQAKTKTCDILICNADLVPSQQSITQLKIKNPALKVLVIDDGKSKYKEYLNPATVDGYVMLYCPMQEVLKAITYVLYGKKFFCDTIINYILNKKSNVDLQRPYFLSEREKEVLRLIANGYTSKEISKSLFLSFHTVTTHRKNICKKLKVSKVSDMVACAYRMNLV